MSRDELDQALSVLNRFFPEDAAMALAVRRELDVCVTPPTARDDTGAFFQ